MKILHVNKFFDFHGGAEFYLHGLMREQERAGHDVHIFSTRDPRNLSTRDQRYFVERMALDQREGYWQDARKAMKFIWNGEAKRSLNRMLDEVRPDVVHLHNIYHHLSSSVLAPIRQRRLPCVQTLHDYKLANPNYSMFDQQGICEHAKGGRYFNLVKYRCLGPDAASNALAATEMLFTKRTQVYEKTVQRFLCPSRFMKQTMEAWEEPKDQLRYVPNPTDLPNQPMPRGGGYLLYAGRLSPEKGLASLLEASASVPSLPIKIAGRGPEEGRLKALIKRLGLSHVELLGFRPVEELALIRRFAEAVVLPTLSFENASGALLEAMADGLPCLATRIGGNPELVEDGVSGILVTPGDADAWKSALRRFIGLPNAVRDQMGRAGREKIIKNHLWSTHLGRVEVCYREAGAK